MPPYAELHCISNFTFLRGASHAEELVERAHELGYTALAITDECSLAGVVRAHMAAQKCGLKLIVGSEIRFTDGPSIVLLATDRIGYGNLSELITQGRRNAHQGAVTVLRSAIFRMACRVVSHCCCQNPCLRWNRHNKSRPPFRGVHGWRWNCSAPLTTPSVYPD